MILPIAFLTIGLGFIIGVLIGVWKKSNIRKRGNRYPAKIYGYVQNTSYLVNDAYHKYMQEGAKYVIVAIWNLYDLVYRKVFYIWGQGILGNTEATLHSGIIPGNPDFNGSRRADVYCLPSDADWRSYSSFGISFIMYLKSYILHKKRKHSTCFLFSCYY